MKGVKRYVLNKLGRVQGVRVRHLKAWMAKRSSSKIAGRNVWTLKQAEIKEETENGFEVVSQTSYTSSKSGTTFDYTSYGVFANQPSEEKIEKMLVNSLVVAYHRAAKKGKHRKMPNRLMRSLVQESIRGYEVREVVVGKGTITNSMSVKLQIRSGKKIWTGDNIGVLE